MLGYITITKGIILFLLLVSPNSQSISNVYSNSVETSFYEKKKEYFNETIDAYLKLRRPQNGTVHLDLNGKSEFHVDHIFTSNKFELHYSDRIFLSENSLNFETKLNTVVFLGNKSEELERLNGNEILKNSKEHKRVKGSLKKIGNKSDLVFTTILDDLGVEKKPVQAYQR